MDAQRELLSELRQGLLACGGGLFGCANNADTVTEFDLFKAYVFDMAEQAAKWASEDVDDLHRQKKRSRT
jgi:hypothetical protein